MRERFSISIDEDSIKAISSLSVQTGLTKSYIVGKYITEGLKADMRLSSSDRYFFGKKLIIDNISMLFNSIGFESKTDDICKNMIVLYSIPDVTFQSEKECSFFKLSLFQLIEKIHKYDYKLYESVCICLKKLNLKVSINSEISADYENNLQSDGGRIMTNTVTDSVVYKDIDVNDFEKLKPSSVDSSYVLKSSETSLLPTGVPDITIYNTCEVLPQPNTTVSSSLNQQSKLSKIGGR